MVVLKLHEPSGVRVVKPERFPVRIGRSVANDVCVDFPGVSARHAELALEGDGTIVVKDLASTNGTWLDGARIGEARLAKNATVFVSDVAIEIVVAEELSPTRQSRLPPEPLRVTPRVAATATLKIVWGYVAIAAAFALGEYADQWPPQRPAQIFGDAFALAVPLFIASGILALYCKLQAKRYRLTKIYGALTTLAAFALVLLAVEDALVYNLRVDWLRKAVPTALTLAVLSWATLTLVGALFDAWTARRQRLVAALLVVSGFGAAQAFAHYRFQESSRRQVDLKIGAPLWKVADAPGTAKLLDAFDRSRGVVDRYRGEDFAEIIEREKEP